MQQRLTILPQKPSLVQRRLVRIHAHRQTNKPLTQHLHTFPHLLAGLRLTARAANITKPKKLNIQHRTRIKPARPATTLNTRKQIHIPRRLQVPTRSHQHYIIQHLNRRRANIKTIRHRLDRRLNRCKRNNSKPTRPRRRMQLHHRAKRQRKRPLAPAQKPRQIKINRVHSTIKLTKHHIKPIPRVPTNSLRIPLADQTRMTLANIAHSLRDPPRLNITTASQRPKPHTPPLTSQRIDLAHILTRPSIPNRPHTRGVVPDATTDRSLPNSRRISSKEQPTTSPTLPRKPLTQHTVQLIDINPRLNLRQPTLSINPLHTPAPRRKIKHNRLVHALPGKARPTTTRKNRSPLSKTNPRQAFSLSNTPRNHNTQRRNLIQRRVRRIQHPVVQTKPNLPTLTSRARPNNTTKQPLQPPTSTTYPPQKSTTDTTTRGVVQHRQTKTSRHRQSLYRGARRPAGAPRPAARPHPPHPPPPPTALTPPPRPSSPPSPAQIRPHPKPPPLLTRQTRKPRHPRFCQPSPHRADDTQNPRPQKQSHPKETNP